MAQPTSAQAANVLETALSENALPVADEPGEILEVPVNMEAQADSIRTVFNDPTNFNVKARLSFHFIFGCSRAHTASLQHPLYSSWTLWFDSPATKGRNMPQTPMTAFPQTPAPQTPGAQAAQGWMEDIKRVISFDSVEEFWGYVIAHDNPLWRISHVGFI